MLDLVTIALILHIIGAVLGVGGATYNDLLLVRAIGDRELGPAYQKNAAAFSLVIWTAIALLVATGLFFVVNDTSLLANQKFLTKLSFVVLLVVNGGLMNSLFQPPLERLRAIDWAERTPALCRLVRGALPFASISIVTWYTVLILGAAGTQPWTTAQILPWYVGAIVANYLVALFVLEQRLGAVR